MEAMQQKSTLYEYARAYLGVPFKHMGRGPNGLDCGGLVIRTYADAGIALPDLGRYGRNPNNNGQLMDVVREAFGPPVWEGDGDPVGAKAAILPGDVVVFKFQIQPKHMAIAAPNSAFGIGAIHADSSQSVRKVVEHGLIDWHLERVRSVFRRPV